MRLQLTVQRHGIPPVLLLWALTPARPPLVAAGSSVTVSQFLEQVNDIIPLESEDWGLEDYVVEVHGFECLHFSELGQILKENDEVCIRPLQTTDLRVRKISGRHQISADGKHLYDGVAFGRPYLRRGDRPTVRIPPRKRRRITYEEEEDIDYSDGLSDQQMVLRDGLEDPEDIDCENVSDEEEDFVPDAEDEDLGAEVQDLRSEIPAAGNDLGGVLPDGAAQDAGRASRRKSRRSTRGLGILELVDDDGQPFVGDYNNPLLDKYIHDEPSPQQQTIKPKARRSLHYVQGALKSAKHGVRDWYESPDRTKRRGSAGSNRSVHFEDPEPATPVTVRDLQDSDDEDDDDFQPGEVDESDKENAQPIAQDADASDGTSDSSDSSSTTFSEHSESDETSSSGSSSSDTSPDSESDSAPDQVSIGTPKREAKSSKTSSSEVAKSKQKAPPETKKQSSPSSSSKKMKTHQVEEDAEPEASKPSSSVKPVAPGQGMNKTQKRNQRRKERKTLDYLKSQKILKPEATICDLRRYKDVRDDTSESARPGVKQEEDRVDPNSALDVKREALLALIASGGVDVMPGSVTQKPAYESIPPNDYLTDSQETETKEGRTRKRKKTQSQDHDQSKSLNAADVSMSEAHLDKPFVAPLETAIEARTDPTASASAPDSMAIDTVSPSQPRRSKLDISGAKRMLFGSLGLRTPKTKQEESETREKLMKDIRPIKTPQVERQPESLEDIAADDSWKQKIDLRAVECCHDGIELSTPPFPFVQRWDPQQQRGYRNPNMQKRKGKKRKRSNDSYYEDNSYQDSGQYSYQDSYQDSSYQDSQSKAARWSENQSSERDKGLPDDGKSDGNHVIAESPASRVRRFQDSQDVNEQLLREAGDASANTLRACDHTVVDLPDIPNDPADRLNLMQNAAKPGTVIAFKQLEMSADTNWQPDISDYRRAIINEVTDNGVLHMTSAKHDQPEKNIEYDDRTGERLYSKFEMPGYDGDDNDGKLEISFDELINPILLRAADENNCTKANEEVNQLADPSEGPGTVNRTHVADLDGAADELVEPSKESRADISELIRDAGWRSSIPSGVNEDLITLKDPELEERKDGHDETSLIDPPSPGSNGFDSSPLVNVRSSPPVADAPSPRPVHPSGTVVADSVPAQDLEAKSVASDSPGYPSLPQVGNDTSMFHEEAQHRSDPSVDQQISSQDLVSNGMDQSPAQSTGSRTKPFQEPSSPPFQAPNPTTSEDELPEPFSQAWESRMSQDRSIKPEFSQEDPISPPSYRRSKSIGYRASSQRESNHSWKPDGDWSTFEEEEEENEGGNITPRPSQVQQSSQIIDGGGQGLDDGYENDSYTLPKGLGWVKKARKSKEGSVSMSRNIVKASTRIR